MASVRALFLALFLASTAFPATPALVQKQPLVLEYHNGALLKGNITVNLLWYGEFTSAQRSAIVDFIRSLSRPDHRGALGRGMNNPEAPSAFSWWRMIENYRGGASNLLLGRQILRRVNSVGKSLKTRHLSSLASEISSPGSVNVVLTAKDVAVEGFCMSRCGTHGSTRSGRVRAPVALAWVGNSELQCPGQCAWPFHQPIYGPQTPPLVPPNGDVGVDGMIVNLATVLAGAVTNPFNGGYFQGPPAAPLEAVSACTGMFGSGSYPGYPGKLLVDKVTGASYNAQGVNGRRFWLPAMWDPQRSACATLV